MVRIAMGENVTWYISFISCHGNVFFVNRLRQHVKGGNAMSLNIGYSKGVAKRECRQTFTDDSE